MPQRKAARVLPEPVGAQISVLAPPEIASQPPAWAGVGPSKEASNQRLTGALNGASGSDPALVFGSVVNPPILRRRRRRLSLRRAAGELDEGVPGGLRHEAFAEQAGAVAEVAGARLVVDREPVDALEAPLRLVVLAAALKAPFSCVAWP